MTTILFGTKSEGKNLKKTNFNFVRVFHWHPNAHTNVAYGVVVNFT